ncbi:hypothetical protein PoMZ_06677 [Pyricularia oryzae]|uniref:Uncharacterized protein n=1 Tax=Pyricularia oryzae TaxID=318829 RepID=A0A4P7NSX3_PYROR|nr:hypothetical protein PoMZ_06677 [Pyricularia oryzae]
MSKVWQTVRPERMLKPQSQNRIGTTNMAFCYLLPKAMELTRVAIRQKFPNRSLDPVDVSASHVIRPAGKQLRTLRAVHDCLRGKICNGPIYLVAAAVIPLFAGTALPVSTAAKEINPEIAVLN